MFHGVSVCGGIAGQSYGNILHCFAKGTIKASVSNVGGIVALQTTPGTVEYVQGLADVYAAEIHVGTFAWGGKNYSGGLYGDITNITHNNNHSYVQGTYTMGNDIITAWYSPEFVINNGTLGVPKLKWE